MEEEKKTQEDQEQENPVKKINVCEDRMKRERKVLATKAFLRSVLDKEEE